jgi:N-acetyl-gamma-glutamyl-phosphate reductase
MKPKVYIDGKEGTTGLQIYDRLGGRTDIDLLLIDEDKRKDTEERRRFLNAADIVFLCLPDAAAKQAVELIENPNTRVIDASTAHRTAPGWDYGFPELSPEQRQKIAASDRVANPGCHATGIIASAAPLIRMGIMPKNYPLTCYSLTGYSGGGKKMIAQYEGEDKGQDLYAPRIYGLNLHHKHLPEIQAVTGLDRLPVFTPVVDDYYKGMAGTILLHNDLLSGKPTAQDIWEKLADYYKDEHFVTVAPFGGTEPMIAANCKAGTNGLELIVCGHEEQTIVTALFDNLGKGASGAAVQNMNIMLGFAENIGLE